MAQDALSDDDRIVTVSSTQDAAHPVPNAWKRAPLPNGTPDAWEEKAAQPPSSRDPEPSKAYVEQQPPERKAGAVSKPERQTVASKKATAMANGVKVTGPVVVNANGTSDAAFVPAAPPIVAQPKGPPLSWRKVLAGALLTLTLCSSCMFYMPKTHNSVHEDSFCHIPITLAVVMAGDDGPSTPPQEPAQEEREARAVESARPVRGRGRDGRGRADRDARDTAAGKDGESARGRGRGRGRGERALRAAPRKPLEPTSPDAAAVSEAAAADTGAADSTGGGRRGRQRGDSVRGRGGRDPAAPVRGRGRGAKAAGRGAPAASPAPQTVSAMPEAAPHAAPGGPTEVAASTVDPPDPAPAPVPAQEKQPAPQAEPLPVIASVPPGLGWDTIAEPPGLSGWGASGASNLPIISPADSKMPVASDGRSSRFTPTLDPIAVKSLIAGSSDPPVERPKSAAGVVGAVSRPRSASNATAATSTSSLGQDVLPKGIPALPADLSLDPLPAPSEPRSTGFSNQNNPMGPVAFPGVLFSLPSQQGNNSGNMWQQFGQPQGSTAQQQGSTPQQGGADQAAFNLYGSKQSFYNASTGDQSFGSGSSYGGISSNPQFGAFNNTQFGQGAPPGLQFGQLQTGFGAPFIPTGNHTPVI